MKTLHVKAISREELKANWGDASCALPLAFFNKQLYIRCNQNGVINWDKAPIYTLDELLIRGNTKIV